MPKIEVPQKLLFSRGQQIRRLLKPIAKVKDGPAWQPKQGRRDFIIATHDGSPPVSDFSDWRFATKHQSFRALYYEKWITHKTDIFYLERAYLHIFRTNNILREETEYLLLHCDPNEPDDANHALYKKGPHLHISVAEQPIPHSHIALCLSNLDTVLDSVDSLTEALEWCIKMIGEQFLEIIN